jgi:manganese transport protein
LVASDSPMPVVIDPYHINEKSIRQPPHTWVEKLQFLGPGFILSASIVGSGELIATTVLGAKAGFAALWIILISCLAKVALQLEFGRHAILTGETSIRAINILPGMRIGKGHWTVWALLIMLLLKVVQIGGIIGGASVVMHMLFPMLPISIWVFVIAAVAASLIYNGKYSFVESGSLFMIAIFTLFTIASLLAVQFTPYDFSFSDVLNGFRLKLTAEELGIAMGAFGITGVASDEIIAYNYWCIEKGYARYTGQRNDSTEWQQRAKGWIQVMYLDAVVAMIIYTGVTITFYLLGAAILHGNEIIPSGNEVIETLSLIYTQTLGNGVKIIYLVGAFFVLFSSVFATLATWTRVYTDIFGQLGWIDFSNPIKRKKIISLLSIVFPIVWACMYLFIKLPVLMVLSGGIIGSFMLLIVGNAGWHFKYKRTQYIKSGLFYNCIFWISMISILLVACYGLLQVWKI